MTSYQGKSIFGGIAIGRICVYRKKEYRVVRTAAEDPDRELERFAQAKAEAAVELRRLYDKALGEVGEANAAIFEVHRLMLEDEDYNGAVEHLIRAEHVCAECAVTSTGERFATKFAGMNDDYMRARAADIQDLSERLAGILCGGSGGGIETDEPVILVAEDLTPSETIQLDKDKVLAFVTAHGSANSHAAILARSMGIPALAGVEIAPDGDPDGRIGIVDGNAGRFYVDPDEKLLETMRLAQRREWAEKQALQTLKGRESRTADGREIKLYANLSGIGDLPLVLQNDAEGIGLFRSEFLYLESDHFPTEEEQFEAYKAVAEAMAGRPVIIRTLDIGADKRCDYFGLDPEENPALGYRGIRICLTRTEVFKTQLRAILRAGAFGRIAILYPMIISVEEVKRIREIVEEVQKELTESGIPFGDPEQGVMIETPAAVMISSELAKEVDFFSIGTNDLTQYALAIDRRNPRLDAFYDAHHPAVLRMIGMVVENAHRHSIRVGICGELGADLSLTKEFLRMGVDELSVSPGRILPIRRVVREINLGDG
ncbi:MAG: phosphoenolpyruvate--protein phosphotransferase [Muribaculum sp.]|nr:phosphoenolpyruvate--protein phosphotransferase [Muribaculum sp.]